jgi:hypothetical protein
VGFDLLGGEQCLYIMRCASGGFLLIALHVDDFLHCCCSCTDEEWKRAHDAIVAALDWLLKTAKAAVFVGTDFVISDPTTDGRPDVLRIDGHGTHVSVSTHVAAMLDEMMPRDAPPSVTDTRVPMAGSLYQKLILKQGKPLDSHCAAATWFRRAAGRALWFSARCRPDIAHATHILSRGMSAPTDTHVTAMIHLMRYLHSTRTHGLLFRAHCGEHARSVSAPPTELVIYHDATYNSDLLDSTSVAAVVVFLGGTPISWSTARIPYVCRSSTHAELDGADRALNFLQDHAELFAAVADASPIMRMIIPDTTKIVTDNSGLAQLANSVNDAELRTHRHIRTRLHHLKAAVRDKTITLTWAPSSAMHADILTKCVGIAQFEAMREHLVVAAPARSSKGR